MYEVRYLNHMSAKVDTLTLKIDNLTITLATIVSVVTPLCEICGVQGHVTSEFQWLSIPFYDKENYAQGNP